MLKYFIYLQFLFFLLINCDQSPDILNGVIQLTQENFDNYINTHEHVFVKFYSPWCGHCKAMKSDYEQAAQILASEGVYLAEVDASVEVEIQQKYQIRGFPTLKFFIAGQPMDYTQGRTQQEIIEWIRKKVGPQALDLISTEDVQQAIEDNEVVVVYFGERNEEYKIYERVGKRFDGIIFGIAKEGEKFGIDQSVMPVIKMFKKFDEKEVIYDHSLLEENELYNWIDYHQMEKVFNFTYRTAEKIFSSSKSSIIFFMDFNNKEQQQQLNEIIENLSNIVRGEILVIKSQIKEGMGERLAEFMEINSDQLPAIRIMQMTDTETRRYVYNGELNQESILEFINQWKNNKLKANYKSEPLPNDNNDKIIKKIVSLNFDNIVRDQTKNVVLMITAPWCTPCHDALPELELLTKSEKYQDIVVGVMDATENEVEGLIIEGFPCIKYYPKEQKYGNINFEGERNKQVFEEFLDHYYSTKEEILQKKEGKKEEQKIKREDKDEL